MSGILGTGFGTRTFEQSSLSYSTSIILKNLNGRAPEGYIRQL